MAKYNSNPPVFYNSGVRYAPAQPPATHTKQHMAKVRRNWSRLPIGQRVVKCKAVIDGITANPTVMPNPVPTLGALTALYTPAKDANDLVAQLETQLAAARTDSKTKNDAMVAGLNAEASTAEGATGGDETQLIKLGFADLTGGTAPTPVGPLQKVTELSLTAGDDDGTLDSDWHADRDADSFELQKTATITDAASWQHLTNVTKSSAKLTGLTSGVRIWIRVRAVGAAGPGPWSDPVSKMVP